MLETNASLRPLNDQEIDMEIDLHGGDGSEGIENIENFYAARKALFEVVEDCMRGEHQGIDEAKYQIESLLVVTAKTFASVSISEEDFDSRIDDASQFFYSSMIELKAFVDSFGTPVIFEVFDLETVQESFQEVFDEDDYDSHYDKFEEALGSLYGLVLGGMLQHGKDSFAEIQREKSQLRKDNALAISREIAKAGLNAIAIAAATRFWAKKG